MHALCAGPAASLLFAPRPVRAARSGHAFLRTAKTIGDVAMIAAGWALLIGIYLFSV